MKKYRFTIIALTLISIVLLMPIPEIESDIPSVMTFSYFDKILHIMMFFGLSFVVNIEKMFYKNEKIIKSFTLLVFYALCTEILQGLTGYRSFEWMDLLADSIGILVGVLFVKKFGKQMLKSVKLR